MPLKVSRIRQVVDSNIQAASESSVDNRKETSSQKGVDSSSEARSTATVGHTIATEPTGSKNYNSLINKPVINADLNALESEEVVVNMTYCHVGETNEYFIRNRLYLFDGEDWWAFSDYEGLINLPSINGHTLIDALNSADLDITSIYYNTTAYWDSHIEIVSERNALYIYTDKFSYHPSAESEEVIYVEGIKIGDGNAYLIDKPFITDALSFALESHINNQEAHVSSDDRTSWNNKLNYKDPGQSDLLEFTRN